jgi:hypothetical protein
MVQPPPEELPPQRPYGGQPPAYDPSRPPYGQPYGPQPNYQQPLQPYPRPTHAHDYYSLPPKQGNGFAIAGIVLAVFAPLLGLIFSVIGLNKSESQAGAGKALSITGIVVSVVVMVGAALAVVESASRSLTSAGVQAPSSPAVKTTAPLGVLPVPANATPYSQNTNAPMGLKAFVQRLYVKSSWKEQESLLTGWGFTTGAVELWTNPDGSEQQIVIVRFATALGAQSHFQGLTNTWRDQPAPSRVITDAAVGGLGWVNPTQDSYGNFRVDIAVCDGDEVIDVTESTPLSPDIAAAEALMLKQYDSLKTAA